MPPKKRNQIKNDSFAESASSVLGNEVGENSIDMASFQKGLEALLDRRLNQQTDKLKVTPYSGLVTSIIQKFVENFA